MEVAGLAIGVVGVAALFSTCIESFDIVVTGKNFSEDYEQLCALVSVVLLLPNLGYPAVYLRSDLY